MEYEQIRFIFQHNPTCGPHTSLSVLQCLVSIGKKLINSEYDISKWTFSPTLVH